MARSLLEDLVEINTTNTERGDNTMAAPFGVTVEPCGVVAPSPPSPLTDEVLRPIERITEEMWPGVLVLPRHGVGSNRRPPTLRTRQEMAYPGGLVRVCCRIR